VKSVPTSLMSRSAYARHRGVHRSYIGRLAQRGVLVMRGNRIDVRASDAVLDDRAVDEETTTAPRQSFAAEQPASPSFAQARTFEQVYKAKLRRLEFEEREKMLLRADDVARAWTGMITDARNRALTMPDVLADRLAAESSPQRCREVLTAWVHEFLTALSKHPHGPEEHAGA
jgi:hypothetical protein